jgi:hypothetical protein
VAAIFRRLVKSDSEKSLGPLATFPFRGGVMGKKCRGKSSASPDFALRDGPPAQKV